MGRITERQGERRLMKAVTSTGDFKRFCKTDIERITELYNAGFRYIDLN